MGASHGREIFPRKSELCLRLADGLSLNNPGRIQLMDLADNFMKRANELEAQEAEQKRQSNTHKVRRTA